ncbi:hypothetical protein LR48_Vigan07g150100 [Vigna angularis]|uniref:Remorin C-terminal domain-containing protein n=1 Tax=Phaseolus angularis TaxID=3914 RepID=A0A0L9UYX9_PHAAN|nr:hypothetical protein LR48_Vigan07g150100 [Vigna angularis]
MAMSSKEIACHFVEMKALKDVENTMIMEQSSRNVVKSNKTELDLQLQRKRVEEWAKKKSTMSFSFKEKNDEILCLKEKRTK